MRRDERWSPWVALRDQPDIILRWGSFPRGQRGCVDVEPGRVVITLDYDLDRAGRRATLAHELIHLERGVLPRSAPADWRRRDEAAVRAEVARRLVPLDALASFAAARAPEPTTVADVAEHFDVPADVARLACRMVR